MDITSLAYATLLFVTAIIALVTAGVGWQRRNYARASLPFALMMLAVALYALVAGMETAVVTIEHKLFWSTLEYVGSGSVAVLFLVFVFTFANRYQWITLRTVLLLLVVPTLNLLLVATNAQHRLVWVDVYPLAPGSNLMVYEHGVGFFWIVTTIYLYVLFGIGVLVHLLISSPVIYRRQVWLILIGASAPLLAAGIYALGLSPPGLNLAPMSFVVSGVIYLAGLAQVGGLSLLPVAHDAVFERMRDGVVVVDRNERIADINPAARQLLDIAADQPLVGTPVAQLLASYQQRPTNSATATTTELYTAGSTRIIEMQVSLLQTARNQPSGRLLVLRDVTLRRAYEDELATANQQLQQKLQQIKQLQQRLQEDAIRDSLTGLYNRRYFTATLERELARADREGEELALILLDIDFFKSVNDTYGHSGGDQVLKAIGQLLQEHVRSSDVACRYGGEEFALALPGLGVVGALERAEQIRTACAALQVIYQSHVISVTMSGGVGVVPQHGHTPDDLVRATDLALYRAKANGRNRVHLAQSECLDTGRVC